MLITKRVEIFWLSFSFLYLCLFIYLFIYLFIFYFLFYFFITEHTSIFNSAPLTLVLRRGMQQPPKQFSPRCSKSRSQGVKLLRVPSSSSFPFILGKNFEPTTYPGGRVSFQSWEVRGVGAIPWFLNWIILKTFNVICTSNFVCKLESPFSNIFCNKSHENRRFLRLFR